jgi:hypothetical protein
MGHHLPRSGKWTPNRAYFASFLHRSKRNITNVPVHWREHRVYISVVTGTLFSSCLLSGNIAVFPLLQIRIICYRQKKNTTDDEKKQECTKNWRTTRVNVSLLQERKVMGEYQWHFASRSLSTKRGEKAKKRETDVGLSKKLTYQVYLSGAKKSRGRCGNDCNFHRIRNHPVLILQQTAPRERQLDPQES